MVLQLDGRVTIPLIIGLVMLMSDVERWNIRGGFRASICE
jgi:hypothetical protein